MCGRHPLKIFTWSTLEYLDSNITEIRNPVLARIIRKDNHALAELKACFKCLKKQTHFCFEQLILETTATISNDRNPKRTSELGDIPFSIVWENNEIHSLRFYQKYLFFTLTLIFCLAGMVLKKLILNPLSANFTKLSNMLKQFVGNLPTNCLSEFGHFVGLALKRLIQFTTKNKIFPARQIIEPYVFCQIFPTFLKGVHVTIYTIYADNILLKVEREYRKRFIK